MVEMLGGKSRFQLVRLRSLRHVGVVLCGWLIGAPQKIPGSNLGPQSPQSYSSQNKTAQSDVAAKTTLKSV